jgi:haloacetate dehalogenase
MRRHVRWRTGSGSRSRPPTPERTIATDPRANVSEIVNAWGGACAIEPDALSEYLRSFSDPDVVTPVCDEYRAGDTLDIEDDRNDRDNRRRIACPVLALWAQRGFASQFGDAVSIWKSWADNVRGAAITSGDFMMEESPDAAARALRSFRADLPKAVLERSAP